MSLAKLHLEVGPSLLIGLKPGPLADVWLIFASLANDDIGYIYELLFSEVSLCSGLEIRKIFDFIEDNVTRMSRVIEDVFGLLFFLVEHCWSHTAMSAKKVVNDYQDRSIDDIEAWCKVDLEKVRHTVVL